MKSFAEKILPAPLSGGFSMADHWVWCGSVVKAEGSQDDGRYHMFASVWEKTGTMHPGWLMHSRIVRASSDTAEGPYTFEEEVLPRRNRRFFDGMVTHNPSLKFFNGTYYLYYLGVTYSGNEPTRGLNRLDALSDSQWQAAYRGIWTNKRIGLATATSIFGPWERRDEPLLEPRSDGWDRVATTNPSVAIRPDGFSVMIYKSRSDLDGPRQLGIATAPTPAGPFTPVSDRPTFDFDCEDPFIWFEDGYYHVIMKDMSGDICGESHAGIYAQSLDGLQWEIGRGDAVRAYSRSVLWADGVTRVQGALERPNLLIQDGKPTHLFAATCPEGAGVSEASRTWNMCIPLSPD